ncbi:hypothetical protein F4677DRAFT_466073 [Hypoxylon crocopeplum]|nr:hypothetical protein F4677DRAFT_466073 [Hypoxylon crocopeplum]
MASNRQREEREDHIPESGRLTLNAINGKWTINSAIVSTYATQWTIIEAFRELVQNWRDGIISSFQMAESDFYLTLEESDEEIVYTASSSSYSSQSLAPRYLGYIRWSLRDGVGTVDITNRSATLQPWHIDMGGTSKLDDGSQAGVHGEGLKIALLVLLRQPQNHAVRCQSGGFSWVFDFTSQRQLAVHLTKMTQAEITAEFSKAMNETNHSLLPIAALPNADVKFIIGSKAAGFDEKGMLTTRNEVTRADFKKWTRAALFLQNIDNEQIVKTSKGDLILDPRFSGNVYMKGLLLGESQPGRSASITGKLLRYGYNFAAGETNRERKAIASANEESHAIFTIWDEALLTHGHLVERLHELLNTKRVKHADVTNAYEFLLKGTEERLAAYLLETFERRWFYTAREKSNNPRFDQTVQGLGYEPFELEEDYWDIIKHSGFWTAEEEERSQFLAAESATIPDDSFARDVDALIWAGLDACPGIAPISREFVKAGQLRLGSFYEPSTRLLKVHEKWLTTAGAKEELGLAHNILESSLSFCTVKHVLADAINQLPLDEFGQGRTGVIRSRQWYRNQALRESDRTLLEHIQTRQSFQYTVQRSDRKDKLVITWDPNTGWVPGTRVRIYLHRETTCSHLKDIFIAKNLKSGQHGSMSAFSSTDLTCRSDNVTFRSGRYEVLVRKGEKYFIQLSNLSDDNSVVLFSDQPLIVDWIPKDDGAKTYTLGKKIEYFDMETPRDWFKVTNSVGKEAVIGVANESSQANGSQKVGGRKKRARMH